MKKENKLTIEYCSKCKFMMRSAWIAQELLQTFDGDLDEAALRLRAARLLAEEMPVVMLGDFNVIPEPRDAAHPKNWVSDALFLPESRAALRRIVHQGWTDAIRIRDPWSARGPFTFWDYQAGAWQRDHGFRIDHLLLSPELADRMQAAGVDKEYRGREKASDHTPFWVELAE